MLSLVSAVLAIGSLAVQTDTTRKKPDSLPLKTERSITYQTSEGTWLSLDVSPDGRTIVFELMGDLYTQDLGSLEPGKLADLLVLDQNPLDDIRNSNTIRYVMKNGRLYDGETLDEVYPRKKLLEQQWWWNRNAGDVGAPAPSHGEEWDN